MSFIRKKERNRKDGVKELSRSNIYEAGAASIAELFCDYVEDNPGNAACVALVLSARPLEARARDAAEKSFAALGYGRSACVYATIFPAASSEAPESGKLDAQSLFLLVEGLDPICVVAADEAATQALGAAYRAQYAPNSPIRVFGRPSVAFGNLESLLETDDGKQAAWRLFKSIPQLS